VFKRTISQRSSDNCVQLSSDTEDSKQTFLGTLDATKHRTSCLAYNRVPFSAFDPFAIIRMPLALFAGFL
jgi:hypothetical protein